METYIDNMLFAQGCKELQNALLEVLQKTVELPMAAVKPCRWADHNPTYSAYFDSSFVKKQHRRGACNYNS